MELWHIPQREIEEFDSLARIGSTWEVPPSGVYLDELTKTFVRWEAKPQPPPELSAHAIMRVVGSNPDWEKLLIV